MDSDWPPEDYAAPKEYEKDEIHVYAISLVVTAVFGVSVLQPVSVGGSTYVRFWIDFMSSIGVSSPLAIAGGGVLVALLGIAALFLGVVIPVHEWLHYIVGQQLNLNPDFGYEKDTLGFSNPRVVALSTDISVWQNLAMLVAPFAVIGLLSLGLIYFSSGFLAGLAAVVLWINSAASAQDLYHYLRLLRMDPNTKFANFEDGGEIRTEYSVPEQ